MYYLATIKVNHQALKEAYLSNNNIEADEQEMMHEEFGWLKDSGIELIELTPIVDPENDKE